jgi:type IV pilus assembly protein PilM
VRPGDDPTPVFFGSAEARQVEIGMATNHEDAAPQNDQGDARRDEPAGSPAAPEAKASPDKASEPPAPDKPVKAPAKAAKPAQPPAPPGKAGKPAAGKPGKPAQPAPAGEKAAAKASPEKRAKPPVEKAPEPANDKTDGDKAPTENGEKAADDAIQKGPEAKGKKKAKAETGIMAKPGRSLFSFAKAAPAGVWGVDLGQCALKAIRLEMIEGEVTATAFDYVEHPKILSQPDADPDELTREALQKFLSRNVLRGDTVAISVPGQSGLARFVKLPPVEEKKIPDIVRFEAKQQIPFNLEEVVWDYQKLGVGELAAGFVETEIGLFAMKRDMVNRYLQHFKDVGVEVHLVQMAPLALCNFVSYDLLGRDTGAAPAEEAGRGKKHCVTALDIGADSSNLVITDGARIIWQRPIPLGGNHFTRALTKDLKLTFAKAEHLKRNAVKSPDLKKILTSLKPVLSDFVGEVQRSLGYFTNTHRDAQIEYMVGLGNAFRLPGLQRYLAEKLQMDVRKLAKMERLSGDSVVASASYTENILSFAVAYGLALQGLKKTKLQTNLLPGEIRAERAVRGKKPWAAAAAALLLLGLGGLGFSSFLNWMSYGAESVATAEGKADEAFKRADAAEKKFNDTKGAALDEEKAVRSIIAGQFERENWLELTHFVFTNQPSTDPQYPGVNFFGALPNPDGSNLSDEAKQQYWAKVGKSMTGEQAYKAMLEREEGKGSEAPRPAPPASPPGVVGTKPEDVAAAPPAEDLGAGIDDLVQVNIEYFDQRYVDDLGPVWKAVMAQEHAFTATNADDMKVFVRTADLDKAPEGKGWVIEVHGYTYNHDGKIFIAKTLVDNIYRLSVKPGGPAAGPGTPPGSPPPPTVTPPPPSATAPPPTGTAATPGGAPASDPMADAVVKGKDIYLGRISHVVLFDAKDASLGNIVGQSVLDALVKGSGASGTDSSSPSSAQAPGYGSMTSSPAGQGMMSATGQMTTQPGGNTSSAAPTRDSWTPESPGMRSGVGSTGAPQTTFGDVGKPKTGPANSKHTRTEFVVVFFWKEPVPSDKLRGEDEPPKPPPTATTAPPVTAQPTPAPSTTTPPSDSTTSDLRKLGDSP